MNIRKVILFIHERDSLIYKTARLVKRRFHTVLDFKKVIDKKRMNGGRPTWAEVITPFLAIQCDEF